MIPVRRLNHAVLFVRDIERAVTFYTEVFGFEVAAREPAAHAAFLRSPLDDNHHDLGLFGIGEDAPGPDHRRVGLYHLAWQLDTIDDLAAARTVLAEHGALRGEASHGATKSLYAADPDGNEFELMWLLPREAWGDAADRAPVEPLDLTAEVERWTGVSTAGGPAQP